MLGLVTKLDGISFALFYVEQKPDAGIYVRWRMVGDFERLYSEWREVLMRDQVMRIQPEASFCRVDVEWREGEKGEWRQAALLELVKSECVFVLRALRGVSLPCEEHRIHGVMRGDGAARFVFCEPVNLLEGQECEVRARADAAVLANVIFSPGDFASWDPVFEVRVAELVERGWVESAGEPVLSSARVQRGGVLAQGPVAERLKSE